jgi:predicted N-acetyltransferase YhbS
VNGDEWRLSVLYAFKKVAGVSKKWIGKSLIGEGLSLLKKLGSQGCVLVGHPNYYKRLGFQNYTELVHTGVPQEVLFALPFTERVPEGIVFFMKGSWQRANQPSATL